MLNIDENENLLLHKSKFSCTKLQETARLEKKNQC